MLTATRTLREEVARDIVENLPRSQWYSAWQGALRYIVWLEQLQTGRMRA